MKFANNTSMIYYQDPLSNNQMKMKYVVVMHDLLNDSAKYVDGGIYFRCEVDQREKIQKITRHFSFELGYHTCFDGFGTLCNTKKLRTFMPKARGLSDFWRLGIKMSIHELLSKFKFISILSMFHCYYL